MGSSGGRRAGARAIRVLVAHPDPRDPGGISAVVSSLATAGLEREVELIELPTSAMGSSLPRKLGQTARAASRLVWMLLDANRRPDLVHLHASTGASLLRKLLLSWCCRIARTPYIAHEHSGELEGWIGSSRFRRALARSLYGHAAVVIVLGERWRRLMVGLGAVRVEVVGNGLSASERQRLERAGDGAAPRQVISDAGAVAGRPPVLLYYGRWTLKKGPDLLADALRLLDRSDYELRIFGSGDRGWMESLFAGCGGRVRIEGWLDAGRKPRELGLAAALLAPSRAEGFPVALVEARAAGTPVVATDVGAVAEAMAGYERALLVEAGDMPGLAAAIEGVLDGDPRLTNRSPPEFPQWLRAEVLAERIAEIYRSVAGRC